MAVMAQPAFTVPRGISPGQMLGPNNPASFAGPSGAITLPSELNQGHNAAMPPSFARAVSPGVGQRTSGGNAPAELLEDPHSLLPRFTRVRVIGNNRTKNQLVGQLGIVKNATGLGGWHRVVLDSGGEEVRLQRNALTVVSRPKGDETDFLEAQDFSDDDEEDVQAEQAADALPRERRRRPTRPVSTEHFTNERRVSQRQASSVVPRINLHRLDATALKRYRQHYRLADVGPNSSKDQLMTAVGRHFMQQNVDEAETIERFIRAAKLLAQGIRRVSPGPGDETVH